MLTEVAQCFIHVTLCSFVTCLFEGSLRIQNRLLGVGNILVMILMQEVILMGAVLMWFKIQEDINWFKMQDVA